MEALFRVESMINAKALSRIFHIKQQIFRRKVASCVNHLVSSTDRSGRGGTENFIPFRKNFADLSGNRCSRFHSSSIRERYLLASAKISVEEKSARSRRNGVIPFGNRENVPIWYQQYECRYSLSSNVGEKTPVTKEAEKIEDDWGGPEAEKLIIHLKENFVESIRKYDSVLVYFYTTWCHHCKRMKPIYGTAALQMSKEKVAGHLIAIDLTKRMDVADMFNIVAVPRLQYYRKGKLIKVYNETRTASDIVNFMKNPPTKPVSVPKVDI